jgi:hypothetical protein
MSTWVDVPVPEELEEAVLQFSTRLAFRTALPDWDEQKIDAHLEALAPEARAVLCRVAELVETGRPPEDRQLAEEQGLSTRELHGLVQEANDLTIDPFPGPLLWVRRARTASGGTRREVFMLEPFAALICQRMEASTLGAPTPRR